jgi:molecular chaperone DnaK
MVKDAEAMAAADKAKREEAEIRNNATSLIYSTEKSLKEVGDKAEPQTRSDVEAALTELKAKSDNGTSEEIKAATEALQQASYKLAEALYKTTAPEGEASQNGASANGNGAAHDGAAHDGPAHAADDVIDAEFKEAK